MARLLGYQGIAIILEELIKIVRNLVSLKNFVFRRPMNLLLLN